MKSMIDELWYRNVSPMDDTRNNTEEMKEQMSYIARHQEELVATLTNEQKAIFEKFDGITQARQKKRYFHTPSSLEQGSQWRCRWITNNQRGLTNPSALKNCVTESKEIFIVFQAEALPKCHLFL